MSNDSSEDDLPTPSTPEIPKSLQVQQETRQKHNASQELKSAGGTSIRFSPTFLQVFFGIQRVACMGVAIWDYVHTRDLTRFTALLLVGQVDISKTKEVFTKIITDLLAKVLTNQDAET